MRMTHEQVNPTRMELMSFKERSALAQKGYQLLKQKRDILVIELMSILHRSVTLRDRLNDQMKRSYSSLYCAQSYHDSLELEGMALSVAKAESTSVGIRNAMGVKLPLVKMAEQRRLMSNRGYGLAYSSAKVDETAENFEIALELVLEVAEKEVSMKRLLLEIEKTKRRVNALDYIVIPWFKEAQKEITMKLEEVERGDLITLKSVKKQLENKAAKADHA